LLHKPRKNRHFSRYVMGAVFLSCGLLLATLNLPAGAALLLPGAIVLFYAPRWNLRIELAEKSIRFSENVVETHAVELALSEIREIRRVEEKETRKGFLSTYPEFYAFVEFETRNGKVHRMHDIFDEAFDADLTRLGEAAGIDMRGFAPDLTEPN
jgi:hypothetical protein